MCLIEKISCFRRVLGGSHPGEVKTDLHLATAVVGKERKATIVACTEDGQQFPIVLCPALTGVWIVTLVYIIIYQR